MKKRILSVTLHREVDDNPDLSWIGEYSNLSDGPDAIDRQARGECGRGEYRYFNPTNSAAETGNPDSPEQDYQRIEDYNRGGWCMMGIYATAEVVLTGSVVQKIRSGGPWGIESDSDEGYFDEVRDEELAALRTELTAVGFSKRQIDKAFAEAEVKAEC
jgi:hypothetical protein